MAGRSSPDEDFINTLHFPGEAALKAFSYFTPELWPTIAEIIQNHLGGKGIANAAAPMVEKDSEGLYIPWIIVRVIPHSPDTDIKGLAREVKEVMLQHGFGNIIYNVHVDLARRPRPAPILTEFKEEDYRELSADMVYTHPSRGSIPTPRRTSVSGELPDITDPTFEAAIRASQRTSESTRSVKHLTCWYWFNHPKGCIKSDRACLYAHWDTGRYADEPRIVIPGGPRLAGRNAHRLQDALRQTYRGYADNEYAGAGSVAMGPKGKGRAWPPIGRHTEVNTDAHHGRAPRSEFPQFGKGFYSNSRFFGNNSGHQRRHISQGNDKLSLSNFGPIAPRNIAPYNAGAQDYGNTTFAGPSRAAYGVPGQGIGSKLHSNETKDHDGYVEDRFTRGNAGQWRSGAGNGHRRQKRKRRNFSSISPTNVGSGATSANISPHLTGNDNAAKDALAAGKDSNIKDVPAEANTEGHAKKHDHKKYESAVTSQKTDLTGILDTKKMVTDTRSQLRRANIQLVLGAREYAIAHDRISSQLNNLENRLGGIGRVHDSLQSEIDESTVEGNALHFVAQRCNEAFEEIKKMIKMMDHYNNRAQKAMENDRHAASIFEWFHHTNAKYDSSETVDAAPGFAQQDEYLTRMVEKLGLEYVPGSSDDSSDGGSDISKLDDLAARLINMRTHETAKVQAAAKNTATAPKPRTPVKNITTAPKPRAPVKNTAAAFEESLHSAKRIIDSIKAATSRRAKADSSQSTNESAESIFEAADGNDADVDSDDGGVDVVS